MTAIATLALLAVAGLFLATAAAAAIGLVGVAVWAALSEPAESCEDAVWLIGEEDV